MPEGPGTFSLGQIALSGAVGTILSFVIVWVVGRSSKDTALSLADSIIMAVLVGISILIWRLAGNTQSLNDDPIPLFSPNDVLCPVLTYVTLGLYAGLRPPINPAGWQRLRALLTVASLIVNVATI